MHGLVAERVNVSHSSWYPRNGTSTEVLQRAIELGRNMLQKTAKGRQLTINPIRRRRSSSFQGGIKPLRRLKGITPELNQVLLRQGIQ